MKEIYLYGSKFCEKNKDPLEYEVVRLLRAKGLKISTAESCTAGYVSKRITDVSGASEIFDCGIVSYANHIKRSILSVSEEILLKYGAVSAPVAAQMANGVLSQSGSDIAVSITGIAGPSSDMTEKPVGLVYIAVCDREGRLRVREMHFSSPYDDIREFNRYCSASCALEMAIEYINAYPDIEGYDNYEDFIHRYL